MYQRLVTVAANRWNTVLERSTNRFAPPLPTSGAGQHAAGRRLRVAGDLGFRES
jgi:hypothetical protein